ncbi:MAG: transposase [Coriobacteriaceae bacterium]|nr:transposase [Coriobacteriaceae bacterium]
MTPVSVDTSSSVSAQYPKRGAEGKTGRPSPKYTAESKQRAVELHRERGRAYADLAREPGCDARGVSDWVKKAEAAGAAPDQNPFQMAEELRRLRREVDRLRTENEMPLKASALFAS